MKVTKENIESAMLGLFYAFKISDYNSECFSTQDVMRYLKAEELCDKAISDILAAGYEPRYWFVAFFQKYFPDFKYHTEADLSLKQEFDEAFEIEVNEAQVDWGNEWYQFYQNRQGANTNAV